MISLDLIDSDLSFKLAAVVHTNFGRFARLHSDTFHFIVYPNRIPYIYPYRILYIVTVFEMRKW